MTQLVGFKPQNHRQQVLVRGVRPEVDDRATIPGRLRFIAHDKDRVEPNERPPFGCVLLVWNYAE